MHPCIQVYRAMYPHRRVHMCWCPEGEDVAIVCSLVVASGVGSHDVVHAQRMRGW